MLFGVQRDFMTVIQEPNAYLEKVRLKRKRNNEKINELGLPTMKTTPRKTTRSVKNKETVTVTPPARRSARVSKAPVVFEALHAVADYENRLLERKIERRKKTRSGDPPKRRSKAFDLGNQISSKKRASLESIPKEEWVFDIEHYFAEEVGNSVSNVERVMRVVQKLVKGDGVRHPHTNEVFLKNSSIHLGMDFRQILDEASEWVYNNGGDRGNGWLIEHPIKKLWVYQQARSKNGKAFSA